MNSLGGDFGDEESELGILDEEDPRTSEEAAVVATAVLPPIPAVRNPFENLMTTIGKTNVPETVVTLFRRDQLRRLRRYYAITGVLHILIGLGVIAWAAVADPNLRFSITESLYFSGTDSILDPQNHDFGTVRVHYMIASISLVAAVGMLMLAIKVSDPQLLIQAAKGVNPWIWLSLWWPMGVTYAIVGIMSGIYRFFTLFCLHAFGLTTVFWLCMELMTVKPMAILVYQAGVTVNFVPWFIVAFSHFSAVSILDVYRIVLFWSQITLDVILFTLIYRRNTSIIKKPIPGADILDVKPYRSKEILTTRDLQLLPTLDDGELQWTTVIEHNIDSVTLYCVWSVVKSLAMFVTILVGIST